MNKRIKILRLFVSILSCQAVGIAGSLFTSPAIPVWYANLHKPVFKPPNWIFAPVWTLLFLLMGISVYLIWNKLGEDRKVKPALSVFAVQLVLNFIWSVLFFGLRSPLYASIEIIVLWLAILVTIFKFYRISRVTGIMLLPYIFWVSFAAILNFAIVIIN